MEKPIKRKKIRFVFPALLLLAFVTIFVFNSYKRTVSFWERYDLIINASLNDKVVKTNSTTSGNHLILDNGIRYIFSSEYNDRYNCFFYKCAEPGDTVFKEARAKYLYVIKSESNDSIRINILTPAGARPNF